MSKLIELIYIVTLLIGIACFTVHITVRAKKLTTTSQMIKWRSTTFFLILIMLFNICDFLILYLKGAVSSDKIAWIYVMENLLEIGLAYTMICMERDYAGEKNPHWLDIFFVVIGMIILYTDSVYTLGLLYKSEQMYVIIMITLNAMPIILLSFFGVHFWNKGRSCKTHRSTNVYMFVYSLVCVLLCIIATASIIDTRTTKDFIGYDKEIYVVFWLVFNIINFIFIWRSCTVDERNDTERIQSFAERLNLIIAQYGLSNREGEIAELLFQGKNNKEIAAQLYLSPNTIKVHASNLYKKLGVSNRVQAVQVIRGEEITHDDITEEE